MPERLPNASIPLLHFDSIGIPSLEDMIREAGSLERWQEIATHAWIERIQKDYADHPFVVLEGQANPDFVASGCARYGLTDFHIILFDCQWETRVARLIARNQPELANPDMKNWSDFLRRQAAEKGIRIIDTTHQPPEVSARELQLLFPGK